jgi:replicative DNA helicase
MDIGAVVLHKLLEEQSLEGWSRLRSEFFDASFKSVYTAINKYYKARNEIPSFEDLGVKVRNPKLEKDVASLELLEVPEIDLDLAIDALIDQFAQNSTLDMLDDYIKDITMMDVEEIKSGISEIALKLDEKTQTNEMVATMDSISLFQEAADTEHTCFPIGINNTFDSKNGGLYREDLILLGGKRGSGKSLVSANMVANQYAMGNTAIFFTIEMTAMETFHRISSMLSGVSYSQIRKNALEKEEEFALAKMRADMFLGTEEVYNDFLEHRDPVRLEKHLIKDCKLKPDNQIIIVDDRSLSLTSIDLQIQKAKAQFGDKLTLVVVDYVNQVETGIGKDLYDWQSQIFASKKLKEYARKYEVAIVSPYQIDDSGATRFAKGLLDSPDMAFLIDAHSKEDKAVTFTSTKVRSGPDLEFTSIMNWDNLRLGPQDTAKPAEKKSIKDGTRKIGQQPKPEDSDLV